MIKARLWIEDFGYSQKLLVIKENMDGSRDVFTAPTLQKLKEGEISAPFIENKHDRDFVKDFMQAICDEAWENGIYPRQISDKTDELVATKYHLEDMRVLALKLKKETDNE